MLKKQISRSYSRKISLQHYGGKAFETMDFSASYGEEFPKDASAEELQRSSALLYDEARSEVEQVVQNEIDKLNTKTKAYKQSAIAKDKEDIKEFLPDNN